MFNNFLKSIMALCMVTSGFSSSSDEDGFGGSYIAEKSTGVMGGVVKPAPSNSAMIGLGDETDTKSPLNVGKSVRKTSDNSVQSTNTTVISSQKTSETESDANTSTSSEEGQSPQKERGILTISTYANDTTEGSTENRNLVVSKPNSSEGSIETVESKQENNVSSVVQFDGIDIVEDCGNREDRRVGLIKSGDAETKIVGKDLERNSMGGSSVPFEEAIIRPGSYCSRTDPVNSLISMVKQGYRAGFERLNNTLYDVSDAKQSRELLGLFANQVDEANIVSLLGGLLHVTRLFGGSAITEEIKEILSNKCAKYGVSITAACKEETKACLKEDLGAGGEVDDDTVEYFAILSEIYTRTYPEQ